MMKYLSRRILSLSALYICIIFGILALQFTSGNSFSFSIGALRVSGSTDKSSPNRNVPQMPLHVGVNGVDFFLDDQNPLKAFTSEKKSVALKVTSVSGADDGDRFTVYFENSVSVSFRPEKRGDAEVLTITASIPEKYQKVVFPYRLARSARATKKDSLVLVSSGKSQYVFTGTQTQPASGSTPIALPILRDSPVVVYKTYIPAKGLALDDLEALPGSSDAAWKAAVERFAANSLVAFKEAIADGKLSEPLVADYVAEMGRIGMYRNALETIPETWRNGANRTWQTNVFFNHLEKTYPGLMARERENLTSLSRKLTDGDVACFEFPSLVPYLIDQKSEILLKDLLALAPKIDMASVSARQAAGILEAMMDLPAFAPAYENTLLALAESCERRLSAALVRIGDNLYLSDDGKTINTLAALQVAPILIRYGAAEGRNPSWRAAGRNLVTSLVAFAGDKAVLPAAFAIVSEADSDGKGGIVAKPERMLDAVAIYPLVVTGNTWYPHEQSLAREAGAGIWAWTCAQSIKVASAGSGVQRISVTFPQGEVHYMVLRGIKPFSRIQIYGMDFHTDPRFETYNSSGYRYVAETETLYLKMRHKSEVEDVVLYYGGEAPKPPATTTPAATGASSASPGVAPAANPVAPVEATPAE